MVLRSEYANLVQVSFVYCFLPSRLQSKLTLMLEVGILGGGQLGRMLLQSAANYPVETSVLENEPDCPSAHLCHHFVQGDIRNFDDVYKFGKNLDALTIEIESVSVEALEKLENEGVQVYPRPAALRIIRNKISQKQFYKDSEIPTANFIVTTNREDLLKFEEFLPAVHKVGLGGYDGRGVQVVRTTEDMKNGFDAPSVLEKMIDIAKEVSQIVAINERGETALFPPVEMVFNKDLNLLDYQISPSDLNKEIIWKIEAISLKIARELKSPGIFAVELFVDKSGDVLVNETAPRVHNSGHHTIEANFSSQFDMLWRIILGYPLGNPKHIVHAAIVNLLGANNYSGSPLYEGIRDILKMENVFVHIYGKRQTRPGRKMGHVTILNKDKADLIHAAQRVKHAIRVISEP